MLNQYLIHRLSIILLAIITLFVSQQAPAVDQKQQAEFNLAQFPYPFVNLQTRTLNTPLLIIAENSTQQLLPTFDMAIALGVLATWHELKLGITDVSSLASQEVKNHDLVFIGNSKRLSLLNLVVASLPLTLTQEKTFVTKEGQVIPDDMGVIMLMPSPWDPVHALLVVTGANDQATANAARAFRIPTLYRLMHGNYVLIPNQTYKIPATLSRLGWQSTTFEKLGSPDMTVSGEGISHIRYTITLPYNKVPETLKIYLHLGHSPFLAPNDSTVDFYINGFHTAGLRLFRSNIFNTIWEIVAIKDELRPGPNYLDFKFKLVLDSENVLQAKEKAWATIFKDSSLNITFSKQAPAEKLDLFPAAFGPNTVILLPSKPSQSELKAVIQLLAYLGKKMGDFSYRLAVLSAEDAPREILKNNSVILIGTSQDNSKLQYALTKAPLNLQSQLLTWQTLFFQYSLPIKEPLGSLQKIISPWNPNHAMLLVSGSTDKSIEWAMNVLTNDLLHPKLDGNIIIVNSVGKFAKANLAYVKSLGVLKKAFAASLETILTVILIAIFFITIFTILIILLIQRHRKKQSLIRYRRQKSL